MKPPPTDLDALLADIWSRLHDGVIDRHSPLHTPALSTQSPDGPAVRTVVLRAVDETIRTLTCHTDTRSGKVAELMADVRVAWVFYDREAKLQTRLSGVAVVHENDSRSDERWRGSSLSSRRCYCTTSPPGSKLPNAGSGLPPNLEARMPTAEETEQHGRAYFAVIDSVVARIDWLWLAAKGHRRAHFWWDGERWQGSWVVP